MDKKKVSLGVFATGVVALVAGIVVMLVNLLGTSAMRDADYLVSQTGFYREVEGERVVWAFSEIGKGWLGTDGENKYDFEWKIEGDKLLIDTAWLYELNDEYTYKIDQEAGTLTLNNEIVFKVIPAIGEAEAVE
ncbi:MAG: DUF5640 domain-containing protein [Candidatus Saccharibacteria bacterium]|nr:DUF5640 domain-containing protein [Candidatus Saccharibacteria bacterium]